MITGIHTLVYSDDPDATRAFFRDVVGWGFLETSPGWLIFASGPSEGGVHPRTWPGQTEPSIQRHELSLMCDDLEVTMADLSARGATFTGDVAERSYGRCAMLDVPGLEPVLLYEPTYVPAWTPRS
ncbi:VOC family protein [Occultella gossypii]|uniref:VOC family protein n=1 Tax=Occultella gossypii TaxID=2800820 RepID=A0ABS7S7N7_9MICO|nr:VOC family protein [Occultella gossypii]MBZ2196371.1 VOC family protein [Occultella gossypii]